MLRRIFQLAPGAWAVVALAVLPASSAQAANQVATLPATQVSTNSANLYGYIDPGGQATMWQFQYGTSTGYGRTTPAQLIEAGQAPQYVAVYQTKLSPNTTYHFRLAAYSGIGTNYVEAQYGADRSFTTKSTGRLLLLSKKLVAFGGFVAVPLACRSAVSCAGRLWVQTKAKPHLSGVVCAMGAYRIAPHASRRVRTKLRRGCTSSLRGAPNHQRSVQFSSTPSTGQLGVNRTLSLRLG
jgi:hypothetical protein